MNGGLAVADEHLKKKPMLLTFVDQELLDARKFYFESGITIQEILTAFIELSTTRDERLEFIIERAVENKKAKLMGEKGERGFKKIEADILYQVIEQENAKQRRN